MAQTIKIKRSTGTVAPSSLEAGELAYSFKSDTKKLYIGDSSNNVLTIGGQAFVDKLDGIETGATADQSDAEIRAAVAAASDSNVFTDAEQTKLSGIESGADVTDATNVNSAGAVMNTDTTTASMDFVVDEDDMASNSATKVPTQQSVKAYVDDEITSLSTGVSSVSGTAPIVSSGTSTPTISIDLDNTTVEKNSSTNKLQAKTATIVDGGTNLATADQIHTFVTGQGYLTSFTETFDSSDAGNFTFSGDTISSSGSTMTLDPSTTGVGGTVVVQGSLDVRGTTTTIDSTTISLEDTFIELNRGHTGSAPSTGQYGFTINRGTDDAVDFFFDEAVDQSTPGTGFTFNDTEATTHRVLSNQNFETLITEIDGGTFS